MRHISLTLLSFDSSVPSACRHCKIPFLCISFQRHCNLPGLQTLRSDEAVAICAGDVLITDTSIELLARLTALKHLALMHAPHIRDVGPLQALSHLRVLQLPHCTGLRTAAQPLLGLFWLRKLELNGSTAATSPALQFPAGVTKLVADPCYISKGSGSAWRNYRTLQYLVIDGRGADGRSGAAAALLTDVMLAVLLPSVPALRVLELMNLPEIGGAGLASLPASCQVVALRYCEGMRDAALHHCHVLLRPDITVHIEVKYCPGVTPQGIASLQAAAGQCGCRLFFVHQWL